MDDTFTYQNLEREIRKAIPDKPIIHAGRLARIALGVGLLGAMASLAAGMFFQGQWRIWIVIPGFVLEILGLGVYFFYELKSEIP